jgi:EmrB/QacA subfamily drug resistance transporter
LYDTYPGGAQLRRHLLTEPRRPAWLRESPHAHWFVVATVCIGAFMGQLDASIVTLALPHIERDLHSTVGAVEWVALSYLLVLIATVAVVGRMADAVGRKLLYVYGFGVFTAGSVLCALAPSLVLLVGARVLQAIGAAMLQANSVALITEATPRQTLGRAIGVQGTAQAMGLALGPAIGGALMALGGWRLIFLVNLPAGAIGLASGWVLLPRSRSRRPVQALDRLGAALLAVAAAGPLVYLSLAGRAGYANPLLILSLAGGSITAVAFVRRERRAPAPLIDLEILRLPAISRGLISGLVSYLVLFGTLFVVPYYLATRGVHTAVVGLQLSALPVAIAVTAPLAGRLVNRVGDRVLTGTSLIVTAGGLIVIALWRGTPGLVTGLAVAGIGLGAFIPANNAAIMSHAPGGHAGVVSGVLNMTRGIGTALGVALGVALFTAEANGTSTAGGLALALGSLATIALATAMALLVGVDRRGAPLR